MAKGTNKSTYGEDVLAAYLTANGIAFEREPKLPGVAQLIDFVIDHPTHGKILLEVKDIVNSMPPLGFRTFDPYKPIREHIEKGTRKFKSTANMSPTIIRRWPLLVNAAGHSMSINHSEDVPNWKQYFGPNVAL